MTTRVRMRPLGLVCVRRRTALLVFVRVTVPDLTKCVDAGTGCDYLSGGGTSGPRLSVLIRICTVEMVSSCNVCMRNALRALRNIGRT